jgi:hypothetical protein
MKLQLTNVGLAPIVVKDQEGYTDFAVTVAPSATVEKDVSRDLLQRLTTHLKALETPVRDTAGNVLVALRWAVLGSTEDTRALEEGLAGLPSLNELRLASYNVTAGNTAAVATGTGLLANQTKATAQLANALGTVRIDLEAVTPGTWGNDISCEVITPLSTLLVTVVGNKITVRPAVAGSTTAAIAAAINAEAAALLLVQATVGVAGTLTTAIAEKKLTGGKGPGVSLALNGTACSITELTATQITFDAAAGISANGRIVPLEYRNGPHASRLSVPVVAP